MKNNLIVKLTLLFLCLFLGLTACQKKPDGEFLDGEAFFLSDYKGKWVVVSYWAEWCPTCLKEFDSLNELYSKHKDKLLVVGVHFDQMPKEKLKAFGEEQGLAFPLLTYFDKEKWGVNHLEFLPFTFLFSPGGELKAIGSPKKVFKMLDRDLEG